MFGHVRSSGLLFTHQPNEDFNIRNEQAKRSINLWLGMYVNAEKHIFEILAHSLFYCRQYRQYIWADLVAWPYYLGCPRKDCVVGFQKCVLLH